MQDILVVSIDQRAQDLSEHQEEPMPIAGEPCLMQWSAFNKRHHKIRTSVRANASLLIWQNRAMLQPRNRTDLTVESGQGLLRILHKRTRVEDFDRTGEVAGEGPAHRAVHDAKAPTPY